MADGMREKTTNVGGVIKRIWYAMTGATQGAQLLSLDDAGNLEGKLLNPVINGTATGAAVTITGEANKLVKVNSSGRVILGGVDDGINKLQINGNAKLSGLAGTGNRVVIADSTGNLSASYSENTYTNSVIFNNAAVWDIVSIGDKRGLYEISWFISDDNFFSDGVVLFQNYLNNPVITNVRLNANSFWKGTGDINVTGGANGLISLVNTTNGNGGIVAPIGTVTVKVRKIV
jgi:hypothetical protein